VPGGLSGLAAAGPALRLAVSPQPVGACADAGRGQGPSQAAPRLAARDQAQGQPRALRPENQAWGFLSEPPRGSRSRVNARPAPWRSASPARLVVFHAPCGSLHARAGGAVDAR
jgi:hypothetical protein